MNTRFPVALLIAATIVSGMRAAQPEVPSQEQPRTVKPQPNVSPAERQPPEMTSNVQVDVTIADYAGTSAPQKKTVTMVTAAGNMARVRAQRGGAAVLNVDATPRLQKDGRVVLQLSLEYRPQEKVDATDAAPINEFLTVLLQSGKPLVVTQAADPSSDRKVTVEVTATILK
jgi:hypothetical protein